MTFVDNEEVKKVRCERLKKPHASLVFSKRLIDREIHFAALYHLTGLDLVASISKCGEETPIFGRYPLQSPSTHKTQAGLSQTKHRDRFILKGAMLLTKWFEDPLRPTRDLDFLVIGDDDQEEMVRIFPEVCAVSFNDGVVFDLKSARVDRIREETEYGGLRITANAMVDAAQVRVVIDVAFGDSVEPGLQEIDLPVLLDFPAPHLRAYAP